jgi:hypothetical protein
MGSQRKGSTLLPYRLAVSQTDLCLEHAWHWEVMTLEKIAMKYFGGKDNSLVHLTGFMQKKTWLSPACPALCLAHSLEEPVLLCGL